MHPSEQIKLYGLDKYFLNIIKLYSLNKMPNKILLSGKRGLGKSTLGYHIINYIFSQNETYSYNEKDFTINDNNKSFKLLKNRTHPNFYSIDLLNEKKVIEIDQIRKMITFINKSSFNNIQRFIMIDNADKLNKNSSNALLKVIEEPNYNTFFILIHNSDKKISSTLKSRCLEYKINLSFKESINIANALLNINILDNINTELINYYNTPGDFINLFNFATNKKINLTDITLIDFLNLLIDNGYYKKNEYVKNLLINYIELFFLKKYLGTYNKDSLFSFYQSFIKKIYNTTLFNLDEESLFMEFKSKLLNA
jgi:DNA polymerase III subunit delta'